MTTSNSKQYENLLEEFSELLSPNEMLLHDDELVCECFLVSAAQIRNLVKNENEQINKDDLPEFCFQKSDLGHGCGSCLKNQDNWKHKII